jgi:hypothetical protein
MQERGPFLASNIVVFKCKALMGPAPSRVKKYYARSVAFIKEAGEVCKIASFMCIYKLMYFIVLPKKVYSRSFDQICFSCRVYKDGIDCKKKERQEKNT